MKRITSTAMANHHHRGRRPAGRPRVAAVLFALAAGLAACPQGRADFGGLGAAGDYGLFGLGPSTTVQVNNGSGTITSDLALGPGSNGIVFSSTLNGTVYQDPTAGFSQPFGTVTGGIVSRDLGTAVADATAASAAAAALGGTDLGNISLGSGSMTLVGSGGQDVYSVGNFSLNSLSSASLVLQGDAQDRFIINVAGNFQVFGFGNSIVLDGILPSQVLFNLVGGGNALIQGGGNSVSGTLLGVDRTVQVVGNNTVDGALLFGGFAYQITGGNTITQDTFVAATVPEPASLGLVALGAATTLLAARRRGRRTAA